MPDKTSIHRTEEWFGTLPSGRSRFASAAYDDLDKAIDTARKLEGRGFGREQISVFMAAETRERYIDTHPRYDEPEDKAVVVEQVELEKERKTLDGAGAGGTNRWGVGCRGGRHRRCRDDPWSFPRWESPRPGHWPACWPVPAQVPPPEGSSARW